MTAFFDCSSEGSMKHLFQLSILGALLGFSTSSVADTQPTVKSNTALCAAQPLTEGDKVVHISADKVNLQQNDQADFRGDVSICAKQMAVRSDTAEFSRSQKSVKASGDITYQNEVVNVNSKNFQASLNNYQVKLEQAKYKLNQSAGRGKADLLEVSKESLVVLKEATFTTCPVDDNGWQLSAEKITLSSQEGWGAAHNAAIRINDTPVMYIPYLTFPLDNRRKTGFLYPRVTSSTKLGIELSAPWYWNIDKDMDATITPRLMTNRGVQLQTEFRYLNEDSQGLIDLHYMPSDDERPTLNSRHLVHWQHNGQYGDNLRAYVDFTQLSDDAYLTDLGSNHQDSTDTQVNQQVEFSYFANNVDAALRVQNFQVLGLHPSSYQTVPQLELSNRQAYSLGNLKFNWWGEFSHFRNNDAQVDRGTRIHIEPSLSLDYSDLAWRFNSELALLQTYYRQHYRDPLVQEDDKINRTLPKFRMHGQLNFEREAKIFSYDGIQTFEPQLQYLYVPYKDQSKIAFFDSTRLQDDYYGLFRDNRYSGLDRIVDANQMTLGATSRFINAKNEELMRLSFGQIYYLQSEHKVLGENDPQRTSSKSALAGEVFVHLSKKWYFNANVQYDTGNNQVSKSNLTIDYRADKNKLAQLNHRYTRDVSGHKIEQLGLVTSFKLADSWHFVSGYYRDLSEDRSIDSYVGLQYESCCWALRLVSRRNLNTNFEQQVNQSMGVSNSFDSGISLQLVIKGFGGDGGLDVSDMLQQGIFGYRRPYFLNQ